MSEKRNTFAFAIVIAAVVILLLGPTAIYFWPATDETAQIYDRIHSRWAFKEEEVGLMDEFDKELTSAGYRIESDVLLQTRSVPEMVRKYVKAGAGPIVFGHGIHGEVYWMYAGVFLEEDRLDRFWRRLRLEPAERVRRKSGHAR